MKKSEIISKEKEFENRILFLGEYEALCKKYSLVIGKDCECHASMSVWESKYYEHEEYTMNDYFRDLDRS